MEQTLINIATELFAIPITRESKIGESDAWDSLGQINLFMAIENELNISFEPEEVIENDSIEKIIILLKDKGL